MALLRFTAAQEVFEAFPTARVDIKAKPSEQAPIAYLRALVSSPTPDDAIAFCAYLLPRREAVWWASQSVRALLGNPTEDDETALAAAEEWVRKPEEDKRREVLEIGLAADQRAASTWVALAAGWSGGAMILSDYGGPPAPPQLTAQAAVTAVKLAVGRDPNRVRLIAQCVERGASIAES
jgi:hypothetical protein